MNARSAKDGRGRRRLLVAGAIAAGAAFAGVGVAGAAQDVTVAATAEDAFWHYDGEALNPADGLDTIQIEPGDTVTWSFQGGAHNVASDNDVAADPGWADYQHPPGGEYEIAPTPSEGSRTFDQPGTYLFVCRIHEGTMKAQIRVGDPGGEDPGGEDPGGEDPGGEDPGTPTPTPTPTPVPQPGGGDDHTTTPAPDGVSDAVRPTISRVRAKARRRSVRVRFRLSEPATVKVRVKRRGRRGGIYRAIRLQAPAGTSRVKLRNGRVRRGRYVVQLRARDAAGNRSSLARENLRARRRR